MNAEAFAERVMAESGPPYVRGAARWDGCDCYGLLELYLRESRGAAAPRPVGSETVREGAERSLQDPGAPWAREREPRAGAAFLALREGVAVHCGLMLDAERALHTEAKSPGVRPGPRITRLRALLRLYDEIQFYSPR